MQASHPTFTLCALSAGLLSALAVAAAPIVPDAGQTSRELQRQPELHIPHAVAPLRGAAPVTEPISGDEGLRVDVKAIYIAGNHDAVPVAELEALTANLVGAEHTLAELDAGAARITAYYREHGYVVARAYLPAQEVKDGVVVIRVMPGFVGETLLQNQSGLSDAQAKRYLGEIRSGDAVRGTPVDRALLLLSDIPGVGAARATLQPGASVGTSDLVIELDPAQAYSANLALDNYGSRYTGEQRLDAALALNSPLHIGDQLSLRALVSDQEMHYARLAYQLPLGASGFKLGLAYADTRYSLGREFASLLAQGSARNSSVYATYPVLRSLSTKVTAALTWEAKALEDETGAPVVAVSKQVHLVNLGLTGSHEDAFWGSGVSTFDVSIVAGELAMDAASLAIDRTSAQSNGAFRRLSYNLNRLQGLGERDALALTLSGQQASTNLNSSEKFSLGGANGVRAYPQGEASGDEGWMINLELRHSFAPSLQALAFYDTGSVRLNHNPYAAGENLRTLAGAGLGLNAQYGAVQLRAALAWRTSGGQPKGEPASVNKNPRLWLQANGQF